MTIVGYITTHSNSPSVLDIGCGSGRLAYYLRPYKLRQFHGIDFSMIGLAKANELKMDNATFEKADFELWRPAKKFDVIVFNEVIGYAIDPRALVLSFSKYLEPSGILIVSYFRSENFRSIWRRIHTVTYSIASVNIANNSKQIWDIEIFRFPTR
jgi:trans-aconitate methyltransferase